MTNPTRNLITRASLTATASYNARWFARILAGTTVLGSSAFAVENLWNGGTTDWNTPANWSLGRVPTNANGAPTGDTFDDALINTITPNFPVVTVSPSATPRDLRIGSGVGATGRVDQSAGTVSTGDTNWMFVGTGAPGASGIYNLTGSGTVKVGGTSTTGGRLYVGGDDGGSDAGNGTFNMNTSGDLTIGNDMLVGSQGGTGEFNLDAGTVTGGGWQFFGNAGGTGTVNINGGTLNHSGGSRTYVGYGNSWGQLNISGGTYSNSVNDGNSFFVIGVGNLANANTSSVSMTGGNLNAVRRFSVGGMAGGNTDTNAAFIGAGKGSLTLNGASALLNVNGELWAGQGAGSTGSITLTLGSIQVNNWIALGREGAAGTFTQTGGTVTKTGTGNVSIGNGGAALVSSSLSVSGGLFDVQTGNMIVGEGGAGNSALNLSVTGHVKASQVLVAPGGTVVSELNLDGGTLTTSVINGAGSGTSNVDFNGTEIIATAIQPNFIVGCDTIDVEAGGLKINSNGFDVGSAQNLAGPGGVTKSGLGILTLTGANTFNGASTVSGGKLALNTNSTGGGAYTVEDGASLGLTVLALDAQMTSANATFGTAGASSLDINHSAILGNPATAPFNVAGNLTLNGTVAINLSNALPTTGLFPLVTYGSKTGGDFVLGTLPNGVQANLVHDPDGKVYFLDISSVALPYWDATNGPFWTTNSSPTNWIDVITGNETAFVDGNPVLFNDDVSGDTLGEVVLNQVVRPSSVTYDNNDEPYILFGSGRISDAFSGSTNLLKLGTGTATINTNNDFTGVVTVEEGTLSVPALANGGVASPLGAGTASPANLVLAGGRLDYTGGAVSINRGFTVSAADNTVNSTLSIAGDLTTSGQVTTVFGKLTKAGAGTLTLTNPGANILANGDNAIPGALRIDEGSLVLSGGGTQTNTVAGEVWIGSTPTSGAALVLNNTTFTSNTWMSVGRGNGTTGLTSSVTATGSTITTGSLSLGFSNNTVGHLATSEVTLNSSSFTTGTTHIGESGGAAGSVTLNGSSITAGQMNVGRFSGSNGTITFNGASSGSSTELNVGQEGGSVGTMTLNGTSTFTTGARVLVGNLAGSTGTLTLAGTSVFTRTGGYTSIGATGTGTLTVKDSATLNNTFSDFNVGDVATAEGTLNLQDTGTINAGVSYFAKAAGTTANLNLSGGTFTGTTGYFAQQDLSTATVIQTGGTFNIGNNNEVFYGERGTLEWNLSAGTVNTTGWSVIGRRPGSTGTVNVSGGTFAHTMPARNIIVGEEGTGILTVSLAGAVTSDGNNGLVIANSAATGVGTVNLDGGSITVKRVQEGSGGVSAFNFDGGLLVAAPDANPAFMTNIDTVTVKAGGAKIDSNGQTIAITAQLLDGGTGGGLTKSGAGFLQLNAVNTYTGATTVSAGSLGGTGSVAGPLVVPAGSSVAPGASAGTFSAGATSIAGSYACEIDGGFADRLVVDGLLDLSATSDSLVITELTAASAPVYIIASYTSLTGTFNTVTGVPSNYSLVYNHGGNQIALVRPLTAYDNWADSFFPGETDAAIIGKTADPDGDGQSNNLEFALGGEPNNGSNNAKVYHFTMDSSDAGIAMELLMTIAVRNGGDGIGLNPVFTPAAGGSPTATQDGATYTVQGGLDLAFTGTVSVVATEAANLPPAPAGYEYRTFSLGGSNGLPSKGFLRVNVTP